MKISVVIPTLQAENSLGLLLIALKNQTIPPFEIIVLDSSSQDNTVAIATKAGCKTEVIPQEQFNHGETRNQGVRMAEGDIIVFMTQDAIPVNTEFLVKLCSQIDNKQIAASTARQIPYVIANPIEKFSRSFNYPAKSKICTLKDVRTLGVKAYFFSNSASAINREIFWQVGGFERHFIVNEDMLLCSKLLHSGFRVGYNAEALVFHSHEYDLSSLFKRYFDIGLFFNQARKYLGGANTNSEGFRYVKELSKYLIENRQYRWLIRSMFEVIIKYTGYKSGFYSYVLPRRICKSLSAQKSFWADSNTFR